MFYVYVLRNTRGLQYIGHTNDLERRLKQHTSSDGQLHLGKYTHRMVYERQQRRPNREFELSGCRVILGSSSFFGIRADAYSGAFCFSVREVPLSQDDWSGIRKAGRQEYRNTEGALHLCRGSMAK